VALLSAITLVDIPP